MTAYPSRQYDNGIRVRGAHALVQPPLVVVRRRGSNLKAALLFILPTVRI
jgi:hypothetical protein